MNAVIIYDDVDFASKAQAMLRRAAHRADEALAWSVKPWRIELLILPLTADKALKDAAEAHLLVFAVRRPASVAPAVGLAGEVGGLPAGPGCRAGGVRRWQRRQALRERGPQTVPIRRASWFELHSWRRGARRGRIRAVSPEPARTRGGSDDPLDILEQASVRGLLQPGGINE